MDVVWTELAKSQLKEIFQYYREVASMKVAKSIKTKIFQKTRKLSRYPELGPTEHHSSVGSLNYRYLVSGNYKIIYRIVENENAVLIAAVFDARQRPDALKV